VGHHISEQRYGDAIQLLAEAPFERVESVIYKCAPSLMEFEPENTVSMLQSKEQLKPSGLLPALFRYSTVLDLHYSNSSNNNSSTTSYLDTTYEGKKTNFAVEYLQSCLARSLDVSASQDHFLSPTVASVDAVVYHTLLWFLAKYDDADEAQLQDYLRKLCDKKANDLNFAATGINAEHILRQCKHFKRPRSVVLSYLLLGMEREAVLSALQIDVELAKSVARRPQDPIQQKDLWLAIVKHMISTDKDVRKSLALLGESGGVIRIEDILPHLPDFTEIELFKEEICSTLEECGSRIEQLKAETEDLTVSAESISQVT
jgi:hypothetical protein